MPCQTLGSNIARGTTDPEIDSVTWIKFSNTMAPLALVEKGWLPIAKLDTIG